uniref:Uncharacterized protein n=2 Tax=Anguilla anguilla TaxID=7936 RepID=A0A0E9QXJ7_ANGAN
MANNGYYIDPCPIPQRCMTYRLIIIFFKHDPP